MPHFTRHPWREAYASDTIPNMSNNFSEAVRVHTALTAPYEKRVLLWLAHHTPTFIHSDHLTVLALFCQTVAGVMYTFSAHNRHALWLVNVLIFLNWLGDSLDGTLARVRNRQRPRYGFYVDHIVDTLGALALLTGLGCSGFVHWPVAIGMLLCFYVLSIESFLATYTLGRFHISHGLFGPTEIRLLLIVGNAFLIAHKYIGLAGHTVLLFDLGGITAICGMSLMAAIAVTRHTMTLYRSEPLA